jgi:hypothetical protein
MPVERQVDTKWTPSRQIDAKCPFGTANGLVENADFLLRMDTRMDSKRDTTQDTKHDATG